jgi:hypothetical protein
VDGTKIFVVVLAPMTLIVGLSFIVVTLWDGGD